MDVRIVMLVRTQNQQLDELDCSPFNSIILALLCFCDEKSEVKRSEVSVLAHRHTINWLRSFSLTIGAGVKPKVTLHLILPLAFGQLDVGMTCNQASCVVFGP